MEKFRHIIFDLGGVLIELGNTPIPEQLFRTDNMITLQEWFALPVAHQFERGEIGAEDLAEKFIQDFDLDISIDEFIELFSKWPKGVYPGAQEMLETLGQNHHLSILSNCNEIHWPIMKNDFQILKYFNTSFSSHQIGLTKPDAAIFHYVLQELKAQPSDVLYFDDSQKNVESAANIGISAIQVNGVLGSVDALENIGIL